MPKKVDEKETLKSLIAEINELLNEVKKEQTNITTKFEKHHSVTMKKLDKLREFAEIFDMTNQVFERRISNIEHLLKANQKISKNKTEN